jgi:inhibitor of KinA
VRYTLAPMRMTSVAGARFVRSSDQSLLVYFDPRDEGRATDQPPHGELLVKANENVRRLLQLLTLTPIAGVRNLHPAYCSLLVKFDAQKWRHEELEEILRAYLDKLKKVRLPEPHRVEIPVCYGEEFGPDLKDVAEKHGLRPEQVIQLHTATVYLVYFLGFVPGFAYLGELPEALVTPRHAIPRRKVPPGSVGIAGNQTGVYPCETPGGWRLLGRTPLAMFQPDRYGLSLLSIGDRVQFKAVSREQFAALESA